MPAHILTDLANDRWTDDFRLGAADLGLAAEPAWSVRKRTLRGGRREGVDVVEVDNGALAFVVVPTRGMSLWRGRFKDDTLGWDSPVADGPVNPAFVDLSARSGLGWLQGFDEWMVRCGLETNGPPVVEGGATLPLHGRIGNIPARYVAVHVEDRAPHAITVEGIVEEAELFFGSYRLTTRITTAPGSNRLTVRDEFTLTGRSTAPMQILYHWNFGPPYLEEGARFVVPARTITPRDDRAVEGLGHVDFYGPPEPGFAEQVYYIELAGDADGRTAALLRNRAGDKGVALRFGTAALPCFTIWKCTRGEGEGYVTGLEPATNYPNPRPFERTRGRVVTLEPGVPYTTETTVEVVDDAGGVARIEAEIRALQGGAAPTIHDRPREPFAAEG